MKMIWESSGNAQEPSRCSEKKGKKKKKKHEKQVWYGSPLDREAWEVEVANLKAAAARNSLFEDLRALLGSPKSRLRLDPPKNLHFIHDPGKHAACAVTLTNVSKLHVAFKFRTTAPHHCYMRPNGGILAPNESIIAIVSKYIEKFEPMTDRERKTKDKFKIISLPVQPDAEYYSDLFEDDEDSVVVERILRVIYIDPKKAPAEQVSMLQTRLAEAEVFDAARKKALVQEYEEKEEKRRRRRRLFHKSNLLLGRFKRDRDKYSMNGKNTEKLFSPSNKAEAESLGELCGSEVAATSKSVLMVCGLILQYCRTVSTAEGGSSVQG